MKIRRCFVITTTTTPENKSKICLYPCFIYLFHDPSHTLPSRNPFRSYGRSRQQRQRRRQQQLGGYPEVSDDQDCCRVGGHYFRGGGHAGRVNVPYFKRKPNRFGTDSQCTTITRRLKRKHVVDRPKPRNDYVPRHDRFLRRSVFVLFFHFGNRAGGHNKPGMNDPCCRTGFQLKPNIRRHVFYSQCCRTKTEYAEQYYVFGGSTNQSI